MLYWDISFFIYEELTLKYEFQESILKHTLLNQGNIEVTFN